MAKSNMMNLIRSFKSSVSKHSPEILTGIGIAGMITTTVLAVKATPKAIKLIEAEKRVKHVDTLSPIDTVKTAWKCYIPAAITGASSIACLIGSNAINVKRNAALTTVYTLSEVARNEYREKVLETLGEKKERAIKEKVDAERIKKDPVSKKEVIITDKGTTLCYDHVFGRYFKSDIDLINRAMTKINREIVINMYASLNDFYAELGLSPVEMGYDLGWNIDDGTIEREPSSQLADDGTPCLVIDYSIQPKYNYSRFI